MKAIKRGGKPKRKKKQPSPEYLQAAQDAFADFWPQPGTFWREAQSGQKVEVLGVGVSVHSAEWEITYRNLKTQKSWTRTLRSWYGKVKGNPAYEPE